MLNLNKRHINKRIEGEKSLARSRIRTRDLMSFCAQCVRSTTVLQALACMTL